MLYSTRHIVYTELAFYTQQAWYVYTMLVELCTIICNAAIKKKLCVKIAVYVN